MWLLVQNDPADLFPPALSTPLTWPLHLLFFWVSLFSTWSLTEVSQPLLYAVAFRSGALLVSGVGGHLMKRTSSTASFLTNVGRVEVGQRGGQGGKGERWKGI